MNILFISQYYPPEIGAAANRIGFFAAWLAKKGHNVSVLASAPNYPEGKIYPGYENRFSVKEENGVTVYRTRIFLSAKSNTASRLAHYLSFILNTLVAKHKIQKPDVMIATSPPLFVGLIGTIFKKLWNVPFILDIRDVWPESVESVGVVRNRRLLRQGEKLAQYIYRNADHITVTSPGIQKLLLQITNYKLQTRLSIVPNGAELDLFGKQEASIRYQVWRKWNIENKFVVLYTGNFGLAQAPEIFIKTAEILLRPQPQLGKQAQHDIVFLLVGSGVLLPKLQQEAREKNLANIVFTGPRPRSEMPAFVAAADACIIPYKKADTFRNTFPSKMFDYMAGGKPIIINLKGEASDLIEEAQCGLLAKEEDPDDLAAQIVSLKNNPQKTEVMGLAGRTFVEKFYQREIIAKNLRDVITNLYMENIY